MCVKAWKAGADNGGATAQGVTKDRITVVAVLPNDTQLETDPVTPKHMADKSPSTYEDAIHDYLLPQMKFYETWGRDIEVKFLTSSGSDEAAQRADVVAIKAMKPFAVFHLIVDGSRRARDRDRQGEDPDHGLLHHRDEGEPAGAVPLGPERRAGRRPSTRPR